MAEGFREIEQDARYGFHSSNSLEVRTSHTIVHFVMAITAPFAWLER
jgi:hypothetical protein